MFLLDTNVVSELRRPRPDPRVVEWIREASTEQLYLSAVTVGEIQAGIEVTREQDSGRAAQLEAWLEQVLAAYDVLAADSSVFREWARLMHRQSDTLMQDALIAAVARVHRLTVVTRNVRDFRHLGVEVLNPLGSTGG
jgi:hypothetical protein